MANQKPLQRLHVMMLKPSVAKIDEALRTTKGLQRFDISGGMNFSGALFVAPPSQATPPWLQFVQTGVVGDIGTLKNRTNSSVLLVSKGRSVFAMTFGHGRYLLNQDQIVEDFGLRVALNGLQKDSLRSMDSLLVEEQTLHVRRQTSRASAVDAFGIDVGRDILRAVTGRPKPETQLHALAGSEGTVAIAARVQFGDLGDACSGLRQLYGKTSYKTDFGWVDNIRRVKNSDEHKVLEEHLIKSLKAGGSSASLTVPEAIDWIECDGFLVPRTATGVMNEPNLQHYLAAIPDREDITVEKLKREKLTMRRVSFPEAPLEWTIFKSLLFETKIKGKRYVLSSGEWYRIADTLATDVRQEVSSIPVSTRQFPAVTHTGGKQEIERDYNARVALGDTTLSLLDRKLVRCRGAATLIEACDLLSDSGELIHVKPWSGSSSLSHLFWQARISAEALLGDQQFRDEVRTVLKEQNPAWMERFPKGRPEPSAHEVVFAMLGTKQRNAADALPFFSQLALSRTSRFLRSSGFKVSQVGIRAVNV